MIFSLCKDLESCYKYRSMEPGGEDKRGCHIFQLHDDGGGGGGHHYGGCGDHGGGGSDGNDDDDFCGAGVEPRQGLMHGRQVFYH